MEILHDMRRALGAFETEAKDEIIRFLDFIHVRHNVDIPPVVEPANPIGQVAPEPTYIAPVVNVAEAAPVVEEAPAAATQAFLDGVPHEQFDEDAHVDEENKDGQA